MPEKEQFSGGVDSVNSNRPHKNKTQSYASTQVGFLLLEHFSLPAFTHALDTLVTANLLRPNVFSVKTLGLTNAEVISDVGLVIRPDTYFSENAIERYDLLVVCGGYRTALEAGHELLSFLREARDLNVSLAGLWNGAWFLGRAGLLDGYRCAIHPEHRPALAEIARLAQVTSESYVVDRNRLTASSPMGAFHMVLEWIKGLHDETLTEGIEAILDCDASGNRRTRTSPRLIESGPLQEIVSLMDANLEEPLEIERLCLYVGRSRRQVQRLFKVHLGTTPQRYYMDLRIHEARRLIKYTHLTLVEISIACGFVAFSHFSDCYLCCFGYRPSKEVRQVK